MNNNNNNNKEDKNAFSFLLTVIALFALIKIYPWLPVIHAKFYRIKVQALHYFNSPGVKMALTLVLITLVCFIVEKIFLIIKKKITKYRLDNSLYRETEDSVFSGFEKNSGKPIYITDSQRTMHTQIVGTTNAGKTESVILPWAIQDIYKGHGLIIIDGKSDRNLLNKLWAYVYQAKRHKDFLLFSLSNKDESSQYNPLVGKNPEEIIERVFSAFEFETSYYRNIQYEVFSNLIWLFFHSETKLTFKRLNLVLTNEEDFRTSTGLRVSQPTCTSSL